MTESELSLLPDELFGLKPGSHSGSSLAESTGSVKSGSVAADEAEYEDDDYEEDEWEAAMQDCGQDQNGHCSLAGSEYCEFDCPFN